MNKRAMKIFWAIITSLGISCSMAWSQTSTPVVWVGASGYETLVKAVATIGGVPCILVVPEGMQKVPSDVTIPNNIALKVLQGADIQIALNYTLTIQGTFIAGPYKIFTDNNSTNLTKGVKFTQSGGLPFVRPEWWGAVGNNSVDCTPAINFAINSGAPLTDGQYYRPPVQFGAGNYLCASTVKVVAGTTLRGVSGGYSYLFDNTRLALPHGATCSLIEGNKADSICLENLTFMPSNACSGKLVYLHGGGSGGAIRGCQFYTGGYPSDGNSWAVYLDNHSQLKVESNYFAGSAGVFLNGDNSQLSNNELAGAGGNSMGLSVNSPCTVQGNIMWGWYTGISLGADAKIYNNRIDQCTYGIRNLSHNSVAGGTASNITGNRFSLNVYGYTSDPSVPVAALGVNNFLSNSGSGLELVPSAAVLLAGTATSVKNNRFANNALNISGYSSQESNNYGIDILF